MVERSLLPINDGATQACELLVKPHLLSESLPDCLMQLLWLPFHLFRLQ